MSIHINSKHGGTDIVSGEGRRTERLVVTWKAITQDALWMVYKEGMTFR